MVCRVCVLSTIYKIRAKEFHVLEAALLRIHVLARITSRIIIPILDVLKFVWSRTVEQFSMSIIRVFDCVLV